MSALLARFALNRSGNALSACANRNVYRSFRWKHLTAQTMSKSVLNAQYAVRGPIVVRANQIQSEIAAKPNSHGYPFDKVIMCNIGNPQELGQIPLTFHRQVLASVLCPSLIEQGVFNKEVSDRARKLLNSTASYSVGAYTHSQGLNSIRETVVDFIKKRDALSNVAEKDLNPSLIFLTDGASPGIKYVLQSLIESKNDGILIPIPQYPLYSATIDLLNGSKLGYYLSEDQNTREWRFDIDEAYRTLTEAKAAGIVPKALVVINPGNPTGNVMSESEIQSAIEFAGNESLVILADEVYQNNIYGADKSFTSFFKVLYNLNQKATHFEIWS
jgi:alanine transaminase